ncbi:MAG: LuxR C-terminal-related transcriptional regulator, partial [Phycisphaerales bacterium JB039]
ETKGVQQLASEAPSPAPGGRGNGTQCRGAGQRQTASAASPQLCISNSASAPQVITRNNHRYLHIPCNRLADVIYLPIPPITIPEALGALDLLADLNIPPPPDYRDHPFACAHCWQMRRTTLANYAGWNDFVSYISAGLLYGHEVERTSAEAQPRRKRPYAPRPGRAPSQRRAQVLQGLLAGQTYNQIARALGVSYHTVHLHTKKLYKQHNVHSRTELQAMLCATNSVHITANDWRMPSELPTANGVLR